ncbi:protein of unknown function [Nitrosotalea devaniterrae]|uniref:Uncharacterized protein n=1 Tax=Nitrosotalea devaniterrae TaxID=1078905 RepID=A0A128A0D7_9ARCH|nr:protein of unknown function [Candidatus Nitrosotalea devanaterra]
MDHMKGTGNADANQTIESMIITLSALFFFGVTLNLRIGSINFISIII